jgi:Cu(I)/Ag(I) efflux system membrane fusion protein
MTKRKAAGIALSCIVMLSSYFFFKHIQISWNEAQGAPASAASSPAIDPSALPRINPPGQGKLWVCPMHPEIMQDHPGTCPICGMDLVEAKNHGGHEHGVHVDTASIQKLGVRLAKVAEMPLGQDIPSYGIVAAEGSGLYNIHSFFDGLIKKSYIHSVGQHIKKGQAIYEIYSPELIMQQKDYLKFIERRNQIMQTVGDARISENMYVMDLLRDLSVERTKFLYENIGLDTVQQMEDDKTPVQVVKILAAESGVVTQINAREGTYAMPATTLFTLANVSGVWVDIALYPDQAVRVKSGDGVTVKTSDGQSIDTVLDFISPVAENNKVNVRATLDNSKLHLRPGSYVDALIHAQPHKALALPRGAVMHGGDVDRVMLARGDGHFLPVPVTTGIESGDWVEITDGLQEGAEVAVNGQFLLDAAASLSDAAERMHESHMHNQPMQQSHMPQ